MRRIGVVTTTRADYGILRPLLDEVKVDPGCELFLIVTGTHLSEEFGSTYKQIEQDGFIINHKIQMETHGNDAHSVCLSMGKLQQDFSELFNSEEIDILVVLGDRYELLPIVSSAAIFQIPIAHIHGGETTEGAIDESIRHSVTKLSHFHFASAEEYKQRIHQLGENSENVFNVGSLAVESILNVETLSKSQLEKELGLLLDKRTLLITLHSETTRGESYQIEMTDNMLKALSELEDTKLIFTQNNADPHARTIDEKVQNFVKNNENSFYFKTLGMLKYFSLLKYVDGVVGNSSSGLIEVPSFKIGTLNIGDRQKGRLCANSVIHCGISYEEVKEGLEKLMKPSFKTLLNDVANPFEKQGTKNIILNKLKSVSLEGVMTKHFFDMVTK